MAERCAHSWAIETLAATVADIRSSFPQVTTLGDARYGSPDSAPFVMRSSPLVASVCFEAGLFGHKAFVDDGSGAFACVVCR